MPSTLGLSPLRYPYLLVCLAIGLAGLLLYLIPGLDPGLIGRYNDDASFAAIGAVVATAMARRARQAGGLEERRMWGWLSGSFGLWTGAELIAALYPEANQPGPIGLTTDLLYFLSYSAWFLGINQAPHHPTGWTNRQPGWRLEQWGTLVVSIGLTLDVGILPHLTDPPSQIVRFYSSGLFVAFDAAVLFRLIALTTRTTIPEWRRWYAVLGLMAAGMLGLDAVATAIDHGILPDFKGPLYDLSWYLPFWVLAFGCSLPTPQPRRTSAGDLAARQAEEGASPLEGGLVFYTCAFVVIHLLVGLILPVSAAVAEARGVIALIVILLLGVLAYRRQMGLEKRVDQLSRELRQATLELAESRRQEAVARLAGGVAHDFNNLLTVILRHSELLQWNLPEYTAECRDVAGIRGAALRAAGLTSGLLDYGDQRPLRLKPCDLNVLLASCGSEIRELAGPGVAVRIEGSSTTPSILADSYRLGRALVHLVRNAVDAMPNGGLLTISASVGEVETKQPGADFVPPGHYACLSVEDSGRGIDPETQSWMFDPYFTSKGFGAAHGLGLAAVHGVMRRHGGYLKVRSEADRGTRFDLLFPVNSQPAVSGSEKVPA